VLGRYTRLLIASGLLVAAVVTTLASEPSAGTQVPSSATTAVQDCNGIPLRIVRPATGLGLDPMRDLPNRNAYNGIAERDPQGWAQLVSPGMHWDLPDCKKPVPTIPTQQPDQQPAPSVGAVSEATSPNWSGFVATPPAGASSWQEA
jgi:hypothetical protein